MFLGRRNLDPRASAHAGVLQERGGDERGDAGWMVQNRGHWQIRRQEVLIRH